MSRKIPSYDEFMVPTIRALKELGGSGTIDEINEKVFGILNLEDEVIEIPHSEADSRSEVEYRLAWTRTYLKKVNLLNNSSRGVWALNDHDINPEDVNPSKIVKKVREEDRKARMGRSDSKEVVQEDVADSWKSDLLDTIREISPDAFERMTQRILRESGFVQVEVTGKSGDGGIDGNGILKIGGMISFHIIFQCKRYKGSVSSSHVRDFRGAMQGRADKGIFITTGNFTRDAIKEATRDGAPPIDLIDGEQLCDKLKELELGVKTEVVENVEIESGWFEKL